MSSSFDQRYLMVPPPVPEHARCLATVGLRSPIEVEDRGGWGRGKWGVLLVARTIWAFGTNAARSAPRSTITAGIRALRTMVSSFPSPMTLLRSAGRFVLLLGAPINTLDWP